MILEEATKEAFGYYPSGLTLQSNKPILAACDDCGKERKIPKSGYHPLCNSCVKKGNTNALGCIHSDVAKALQSIARKGEYTGENNPMFGRTGENSPNFGLKGEKSPAWQGGKVKRICKQCGKKFEVKPSEVKNGNGKYCSHSCALKSQRHKEKPAKTVPEKIFEDICTKNNLPFKFVGDGALWIGRANPDFVHNTKKILIEVFGNYFHSPLLNKKIRYTATFKGRIEQLKEEGYKCIILWESDLKREDAEKFVMHTLHKEGVI